MCDDDDGDDDDGDDKDDGDDGGETRWSHSCFVNSLPCINSLMRPICSHFFSSISWKTKILKCQMDQFKKKTRWRYGELCDG